MKVQQRPAVWRDLRQQILRWSGHPTVEAAVRLLGAAAGGFLLAGVRLQEGWMPLAIALAASFGLSLASFAAYAGAALGYVAFFGLHGAMEPMAVGLLTEACLCIFGEQVPRENRWFLPGCAMVFTALVGFLFLLEGRMAHRLLGPYVLRIALAGGSVCCLQLARQPEALLWRMITLAALCAGAFSLAPGGLPLGLAAACTLSAAAAGTSGGLLMGALCGLATDLVWSGGSAAAVLILAALACRKQTRQWARLGLWFGGVLVGTVLTGTGDLLVAAALPGAALSLLVPGRWFSGHLAVPAGERPADGRLALASDLLERLSLCLTAVHKPQADPDTAAVFDRAAERVCRLCSQWEDCWGENLESTCQMLDRAAPVLMTRGKALREDLAPAFAARCCHLEGFLQAINRELDDLSCRRQARSRLRESRQVLAQQYHGLARALGGPGPGRPGAVHFHPELGYCSRGRQGNDISGDRGASFRVGHWFYVLLCDGMGTGQAAAGEAIAAIEILRTLLQANLDPESALELLNGVYILRDDGAFATVDLLQVDLNTGEGRIFKWGSAPSYVKACGTVEKIGTASPPPGLGAGEMHRPEGEKLSLSKGEMLVMVSDGAGGEAAERFIRQYGGLSPKELASGVVAAGQTEGEDDTTAVVLLLRSRLSA